MDIFTIVVAILAIDGVLMALIFGRQVFYPRDENGKPKKRTGLEKQYLALTMFLVAIEIAFVLVLIVFFASLFFSFDDIQILIERF